MIERAKDLKELLMQSYIWEYVEGTFNKSGLRLTDEDIELYVYVIDAHASVDELQGISMQYMYVKDAASNNFKDYKEIIYSVEPFIKKILYLTDSSKLQEYNQQKSTEKGLVNLCKYIKLINDDYKNKKDNISSLLEIVRNDRNANVHDSYKNKVDKIMEMIWTSIFIELWTVRKYRKELIKAKSEITTLEYDKILEEYAKKQVDRYEEEIKNGFRYVQIEYEKNMNEYEYGIQKSDQEVIKGTAETLLNTIDFDKTPSIKLSADAGMGKTKMMEYINYMLMKNIISKSDTVFPILIYCNDVEGDLVDYSFDKTVNEKFNKFLLECNCEHIKAKGLIEYLVDNYKVMFILDGLNEINKGEPEKLKFITSLENKINIYVKKECYFLMTERSSIGANTVKENVVFYRLSEISDEIKMEFFKAKGNKVLLERLEKISSQYDGETQKKMNDLLRKPFYLSKFCELADSLDNVEDAKWPKNRYEMISFFIKELIKREKSKGELAANEQYIMLYLLKLAHMLNGGHCLVFSDILEGFSEVTNKYGLNKEIYSSDHMLDLLQQLGIMCYSGDMVYINDIYRDYFVELRFKG